jgi:ADP-ribose pyrophosphatase
MLTRSTAQGQHTMSGQHRSIYRGRIVSLDVEHVELPNGECVELEVVRHPGGAAIVALDETGRVCLLRQFRHAAGGWMWELPAGKLDAGESPACTARRELAEEASVAAVHWEPLGSVVSSPGVFTEVVHLFLARELSPAVATREHGEVFEATWVPLEQAWSRAMSGEIVDGKTIIGLARAWALLASRPDSTV